MVGLVKFHPLFIRRVNGFDRVRVGSDRSGWRVDGYLHSPNQDSDLDLVVLCNVLFS